MSAMNTEDYRGDFRWINPSTPEGFPTVCFMACFRRKKPKNIGGRSKKRRGKNWVGLGKREISCENGYIVMWTKGASIRASVRMTLKIENEKKSTSNEFSK